jgi:plasmid replication initiation protein
MGANLFTSQKVARIENAFIFNARYNLSAREQKLILYLIAQIDPKTQKEFQKQVISIRELDKHLIEGKRSGSLYKEMTELTEKISTRQIKFDSDIEYKGKKLKGIVNWFGSIVPCVDKHGNTAIEFEFSNKLKPFLIDLTEYARISIYDTLRLGSGVAIRLFQLFRAQRDKMAKYEKTSSLSYELDEFKILLGLEGKYSDIRNFKRDVIDTAIKQINKETTIKVLKPIYTKTGRRVTGVKFQFKDDFKRNTKENGLSTLELTFAENKSLDFLIDFGIKEEIGLNLISRISSSEFRGFEDWYFEEAIKLFLEKTNQKKQAAKAGTFVKWFIDGFGSDNFSSILEKTNKRKKALQAKDIEAWTNRLEARNMTASEFRNLKS